MKQPISERKPICPKCGRAAIATSYDPFTEDGRGETTIKHKNGTTCKIVGYWVKGALEK